MIAGGKNLQFNKHRNLQSAVGAQPFMPLLADDLHNSRHALRFLSHSHLLTATNFLDVVSPSPFGSPSYPFSFSGWPFWGYLGPRGVAHSGYMSGPLSSHAPHSLYYFRWTSTLNLTRISRKASINQSNFYSANIRGEARFSGATAKSKLDEKWLQKCYVAKVLANTIMV